MTSPSITIDLTPKGSMERLEWLATAGTGVGEWLVVAVWGLVSLVLLALGFIAARPRLSPLRARG